MVLNFLYVLRFTTLIYIYSGLVPNIELIISRSITIIEYSDVGKNNINLASSIY